MPLVSCLVVNIWCRSILGSWWSLIPFGIAVLAIGWYVHVGLLVLILQTGPALLTDKRAIFWFWWIIFEESLWSRWLTLAMVWNISRNVFALIKTRIHLHIQIITLLLDLLLVRVVHNIRVGHMLGVYASTSFDHWELLGVEVFIGVRGESTSERLSWIRFLITPSSQIWKLLLGFAEFVVLFFLIWIDPFDLVSRAHFDLGTMASHVIRVFTVLRKAICKRCSNTAMCQRSSVLLLEHHLLLTKLLEPVVFKCLTCCDTVIRIVDQQFLY